MIRSPFNVHNGPGWRALLQLAEEETDLIRMRAPTLRPAPQNCMDAFRTDETEVRGGSRFVWTTWRVGGKIADVDNTSGPGVDTVWQLEYPLKGPADAEAYLQLLMRLSCMR